MLRTLATDLYPARLGVSTTSITRRGEIDRAEVRCVIRGGYGVGDGIRHRSNWFRLSQFGIDCTRFTTILKHDAVFDELGSYTAVL